MSTTKIYTAKTFNFNNLALSPEKAPAKSKHGMKYRYYQQKDGNRNKILMQTPKMTSPFGLKYNEPFQGGDGPGNWTITLQFSGIDSRKYAEDGEIVVLPDADPAEVEFFKWCHELDKFTQEECSKPAAGSRKSKRSDGKTYKSLIKVSDVRKDGEPTGEYHKPQVSLKVASYNGVELKAFDKTTSQITNGVDKITPYSEVIVVFTVARVYVQNDKYGPQCYANRTQFWPQSKTEDMDFLDEETGGLVDLSKVIKPVEENFDGVEDSGEIDFIDE